MVISLETSEVLLFLYEVAIVKFKLNVRGNPGQRGKLEKKWDEGDQYNSKIQCIYTTKSRFKEEGE